MSGVVQLELDDEPTRALLNLITEAIEDDKYPLSPRVRVLRDIVMKFGEIGGLPPELASEAQAVCAALTGSAAAKGV